MSARCIKSHYLGSGLLLGLVLWAFSGIAAADYRLNLQPPVTPVGREILQLHDAIFIICVVIFVGVFGVMFYSIYAHRKSRGHQAATFHESTTVEIIWTTIPFLILVGMAIPSTATLLRMENTKSNADLVVKITGYQWKWRYEYPDQHIDFFSTLKTPAAEIDNKEKKDPNYLLEVDNPLVLPVGKKVRFLVTANDVIHSWWVPAFGVKDDAIPGFIHEAWARVDKPGTYRGQCAELCGKDHGFMPIVVKAVSDDEFTAWVKQQQTQAQTAGAASNKVWTKAELMAHGKQVYQSCAACHGAEGKGVPGVFPPMAEGEAFSGSSDLVKNLRERGFVGGNGKIVMGPLKNHLDIVLHGIPGTAMQAFGSQMNDADIAAVVTYERNSFGNHTGDVVQPSQVKALR